MSRFWVYKPQFSVFFDFNIENRILIDHKVIFLIYGECSSVGRASGCGSEGRGFDPHHSPQYIQKMLYKFENRSTLSTTCSIMIYMSGCSAIGSALALGARGCQFKSGHPDHFLHVRFYALHYYFSFLLSKS